MKNIFLLCAIFSLSSYPQELMLKAERVHGPTEYYTSKIAKLSSQIIPPLVTTYKVLRCPQDMYSDYMRLGIAGLVWAGCLITYNKYIERNPLQTQKFECTVNELTNLIASFPEVVDRLSVAKLNDFKYCPSQKIMNYKLYFTVPELHKMFEGYLTYYGLDSNGKPVGHIIVEDEQVNHPLITAWAKNRHDWNKWW